MKLEQWNSGRARSLALWGAGVALTFGAGSVMAQDGDLVADFGDDGVVTVGYDGTPLDSYQAAAEQADSSILAAGVTFFGNTDPADPTPTPAESSDLLIGRFNADGSVLGSQLVPDVIPGRLTGVAVSAAGEIVVVGFNDRNPESPQVRKFNSTGTSTGTFTPAATPGVTVQCQGKNVVFDTGGKILVPCTIVVSATQAFPAIARFNSNLSLDTSFGADADGAGSGTARTGFALGSSPNTGFEAFPRANVVASDGSGGYYLLVTNVDSAATPGVIPASIFVQHFLSNGTLDAAYAGDGRAEVAGTAGSTYASIEGDSLFVDSDAKLVVGGSRFGLVAPATGPGAVALVARLNTDGTTDGGFGTGGRVDPLSDEIAGGFSAIALFGDSENRLYVLNSKLLTRLTASGTIDATFDRAPSNLATITGVREENSKYGGAVVVDGGSSALLLGGVDQFLVALDIDDSTALATIAKIDLGADSAAPVVNFTTATRTVFEGAGTIQVALSLSRAATSDVTVPVTFGGTASEDDYRLVGGTTVLIRAGQTTGSLAVRLTRDSLDEKVERLIITIGTPTNATAGTSNAFALRINDDDDAPSVSFEQGTNTIAEGRLVAVVVTLSAASGKTVGVPFVISGSAQVNDYTVNPTGTVFFAPGQTRRTIVVRAVDDAATEPKETVVLSLLTTNNATLGSVPTRTVSIGASD